jgi:tRNA-2-methylthio-N6-dimethylallyladenosine synthase
MPTQKKRIYIETYGCQMNMADTELALGILSADGFEMTDRAEEADVLLINTCSIREHAEQRIYGRLGEFKRLKAERREVVVGVMGCMAERVRTRLTTERANGVGQIVDIIVGPDEYRKLPELINTAWHGERGIAVQLSRVETYDDITPLRTGGITAWISVMRGCDKFCTFCVVPFTRGRERSRQLDTIVEEVVTLASRGFREVTLLGQNVNSYTDGGKDFADLLHAVAGADPRMRIRFTTSHPHDMTDKLIRTIASHDNICNYIHLPIQSGSDRILSLMNRTYNTARYLGLISRIRDVIPGVSVSTDIITGFPTETEEDHQQTIDLMSSVRFDGAFMFKYSPRENTPAHRMGDDVPDETKTRRIDEIMQLQSRISGEINRSLIGTTFTVLVEGESRRSPDEWQGRTDANKVVIFPKCSAAPGSYINVTIERVNAATLFGMRTEKSDIMEAAA